MIEDGIKVIGVEVPDSLFDDIEHDEELRKLIMGKAKLRKKFKDFWEKAKYDEDMLENLFLKPSYMLGDLWGIDLFRLYEYYDKSSRSYGVITLLCEIIYAHEHIRFLPLRLSDDCSLLVYHPSQFISSLSDERMLTNPNEVRELLQKYLKLISDKIDMDKMGYGVYELNDVIMHTPIFSDSHYEEISRVTESLNRSGHVSNHTISYPIGDILIIANRELSVFKDAHLIGTIKFGSLSAEYSKVADMYFLKNGFEKKARRGKTYLSCTRYVDILRDIRVLTINNDKPVQQLFLPNTSFIVDGHYITFNGTKWVCEANKDKTFIEDIL